MTRMRRPIDMMEHVAPGLEADGTESWQSTDTAIATLAVPVVAISTIATIIGTDGDDELAGTTGDDVIHGLAGNDSIKGRGGNDTLFGDEGDDVLSGDAGADTLSGGDGFDIAPGIAAPPQGSALISHSHRQAG